MQMDVEADARCEGCGRVYPAREMKPRGGDPDLLLECAGCEAIRTEAGRVLDRAERKGAEAPAEVPAGMDEKGEKLVTLEPPVMTWVAVTDGWNPTDTKNGEIPQPIERLLRVQVWPDGSVRLMHATDPAFVFDFGGSMDPGVGHAFGEWLQSVPVEPPPASLIAALVHEIEDSVDLAESQLASEKLGGNAVKIEYWKGELAALSRMVTVLATSCSIRPDPPHPDEAKP